MATRLVSRGCAALLASTLLIAASPASGQTVDTAVEVRGCDADDALVAAIRVELAAVAAPITKVTVVCLASARVLVVAFPASTTSPAAREVDVADAAPDTRTRSVAIATGELLRSLAGEGRAEPAPAPAPTPLPPSPPPALAPASPPAPLVVSVAAPAEHARPPRTPDVWSIGAAMHGRVFPTTSTALVGPAVEVDLRLADAPVRLRLASDLGFADESTPKGDVSLTTWSGSVAFTLHAESGVLLFDAGPFGEGGGAFASGSSNGSALPGSGSKPIALVGAQAIIGARFFDAAIPYFALDAGGALAGVETTADEDAVLAVSGPFLGARLGLAIAP